MPERAPERLLLVTGRLARPRLEKVAATLPADRYSWSIADAGVKVAALMTEEILRRRVSVPPETDRVILPGRCRADLDALSRHFGKPVERGPDEVVDLPAHLGLEARGVDLSRHDLRIFAEIVDAPRLTPDAILARAQDLARRGADVIDIGGLPDTPFPHLEETVRLLKGAGLPVSVDSFDPSELARGAAAGADLLLSLNEESLDLAFESDAVPVLVPVRPNEPESLYRAIDRLAAAGRPFLADPILEPIHFGFVESILRYAELRRRYPDIEILMGTGNLTELTEADSLGVTAALLGICSELSIRNVLIVQVSPHTRRTVEEHDWARRIMHAAKADGALPKGYGRALIGLHDTRPLVQTPEDIAAEAAAVRDPNYRIAVAEDGVHVFNRSLHSVETDALAFFPKLGVESDGGHAFYLGAELAKAEIAWRLGKRYVQDEPLDWGCSADRPVDNSTGFKEAGHTLRARVSSRSLDPAPPRHAEEARNAPSRSTHGHLASFETRPAAAPQDDEGGGCGAGTRGKAEE
jgi:dihydropteroate synthase